MNRKMKKSKASMAYKVSALTLAIGAMTPLLSACDNAQNGTPATQQTQKGTGISNPCAPMAASDANASHAATNPCAPQAATNPCAPAAGDSNCDQAANPCAPAANCDK